MLDILATTIPIYITICIGFMATRMGLFVKADMRVFGKFVVNLALPALLFNALAQRKIGDILNVGYLLAYLAGSLAGSLAAMGLGYYWSRRMKALSPTTKHISCDGHGPARRADCCRQIDCAPAGIAAGGARTARAGFAALDPALRMAAVLMAAMPMMSIYPILAQAYGQEDFSATALLMTTVAAFFTLSGLLLLFKHMP